MLVLTQEVAGREATINVVENGNDYHDFLTWVADNADSWFACDTETTGLDLFGPEFRVRTIQLGIGLEAWVLPVEEMEEYNEYYFDWLTQLKLIFQNASYDVIALKQGLDIELDWEKILDTKILAALVDSRPAKHGGVGHSLQELTAHYIDAEVASEIKGSMSKMARANGLKVGELFANIDLWDEDYLRYAGMDVVLTYALRNILEPLVPESAKHLIAVEHTLARICSEIESNGFLLDVGYSEHLSEQLLEEQEVWASMALLEYGTESVSSNIQVAADLIEAGVELTELTDSGNYKMSSDILEPLAESGVPLAQYVLASKEAGKWRKTWVQKFLDNRDAENRCHASIQPLAARTGRMSITGIPAQTLPATGWEIRRCFIADPGMSIVSCDYQAQELRVLAALSRDQNMQRAFKEHADLHQITADASGVARSVGKTVNFAYVYGSGAGNIASTCNISVPKAREVIKGFETTYPGVKSYSDQLSEEAKRDGYIVTPSGRRLYVDPERSYAALNYMIQSTSRDITVGALLRLDAAGYTKYIRLPIHDEILACVPKEYETRAAKMIADVMETEFMGVLIESDHDVFGDSWGGGYVDEDSPEDVENYNDTFKKEIKND